MLAAQAAFMIGFSSVVPFIAVLADDRFHLGPAAIGAIVGARVAVQQGLFIVGALSPTGSGPGLCCSPGAPCGRWASSCWRWLRLLRCS